MIVLIMKIGLVFIYSHMYINDSFNKVSCKSPITSIYDFVWFFIVVKVKTIKYFAQPTLLVH